MKRALLNLIFLACLSQAVAQEQSQAPATPNKSGFISHIQNTVWTAGISGVVVDDDGQAFKKLFEIKNTWNILPYPTRLTLEGYVDKGFSVEGSFTYAVLRKGKLIDDRDLNIKRSENVNLIAFDVNAKYDLNKVIGDTKFFNPYVIGGFGYTYRSFPERKNAFTGNFGLGFNVWIYKGFGINVQSMAKFALNNAFSKNYLMHSVGIVYRFKPNSGDKNITKRHRFDLFRGK